jgi:hypothetical protein
MEILELMLVFCFEPGRKCRHTFDELGVLPLPGGERVGVRGLLHYQLRR